MSNSYDSILVMSFGGPEGMDDVMPFLENVLRGKGVPEERKLEVAHHYESFNGISPINDQNRALIAALESDLAEHGIELPVYWGNRNWHPFIKDTLTEMGSRGHRKTLAIFTSAYSSYSGCRQYREDIKKAREAVGDATPEIDKVRVFYNHPGFIQANAEAIQTALEAFPEDRRNAVKVLFTAHSIPLAMAESSNYESQLRDCCEILADELKLSNWDLVYQSRSGPPHQPWLEPDVCDVLETLAEEGLKEVVISPVGFISDHLEVLFDLDTEAKELCDEKGIHMERAATAGTHPSFIACLRELIQERLDPSLEKRALGPHGPWHDVCPQGCCPAPVRPGHPGKH